MLSATKVGGLGERKRFQVREEPALAHDRAHARAVARDVGQRDRADGDVPGGHFAFISATVVSSMRLEKPHSLSYQLETFTSRPGHLGQRGVERRRRRVVVEVDRHQRRRVVVEDALERPGFRRRLHDRVDLVDRRVARGDERQVDQRHVDRRHADRVAVELAVQFRQHEADRGGRAGLGRDHAHRRGTRAAQVLVIDVGQHLVVGVRMHRRHQAADHADLVVQRLDQRRQAVGRARRIRDDRVRRPSAPGD